MRAKAMPLCMLSSGLQACRHVSHELHWSADGKFRQLGRQPGDRTNVILSDGRKLEAKLLGSDATFDLSLLQILPKGADLDGQLVGILGDNTAPRHISNGLSPPDLSRVGPWTTIPNQFIHHSMAQMLRSEVIPYDRKAADKYFNGSHSYRWAANGMLPRRQWTQGRATVDAFREVIHDARRSVVTILDETDHVVAYGTIVSADGEIVTLASTLPKTPRCRISNSREVDVAPAEIVGMNSAFDLALLKAPMSGLPPIKWKKGSPPEAGTLLGSVGMTDQARGAAAESSDYV